MGKFEPGPRAIRAILLTGLFLLATSVPAGAAATPQPPCASAAPPAITKPAAPLRFGITPQLAGSVGTKQGAVAPEDPARTLASLTRLRPRGREFVLRLNRLFLADGQAGIRRFAALIDRYARAGFRAEVQVRFHPRKGQENDLLAWDRFVRAAVRQLGRRRAVVGFSITNEANLPISANTSDGAYPKVKQALVRGVVAADAELRRLGRADVQVGFNVMWRWTFASDARFWDEIGTLATPAFRKALDYVGVQAYPGLVWPPPPLAASAAGARTVEALTLMRRCYMPRARLGRGVALYVSENGYATNLGRTERQQAAELGATLRAVHRASGTLGVTDYRYFNLRDNASAGADLFSAVGVLRDNYAPKPAFATLRAAIATRGQRAPGSSP